MIRDRKAAKINRRAEMMDRLRALVERDGPDSIWAELIAECSK